MSVTKAAVVTDSVSKQRDIKQKYLTRFISLMNQFLTGMRHVFPKCLHIKTLCMKFEVAMAVPVDKQPNPRDKLIRLWHKSMHPFYNRCRQCDETVWQELCKNPESYMHKLDLLTKWNSKNMTPDNKSTIWKFIIPMNKCSKKYNTQLVSMLPQQANIKEDINDVVGYLNTLSIDTMKNKTGDVSSTNIDASIDESLDFFRKHMNTKANSKTNKFAQFLNKMLENEALMNNIRNLAKQHINALE